MTLIVTSISNLGIIQASDSNLTDRANRTLSGPKVFPLRFAPAALALAGTYSVGGVAMDTWMPQAIAAYAASAQPSLEGFAHYLGQRLTKEIIDEERQAGSLIHISGYVDIGGESHPEMHFVRNLSRINSDGDYEGADQTFEVSEDFWTRDHQKRETREALAAGGSQRYFNGFAPGRIAYVGVSALLDDFFAQAWDNPKWKFKPPETLEQQAEQLKLAISAIGALFASSNYDAPFIGGEIQAELVQRPAGALPL